MDLYVERERVAVNTGTALVTTDLDGIMIFKPWISATRFDNYWIAISQRWVPPPLFIVYTTGEQGPEAIVGTDALLYGLIVATIPPKGRGPLSADSIGTYNQPTSATPPYFPDFHEELVRLRDGKRLSILDDADRRSFLDSLFRDIDELRKGEASEEASES